MKTSLVLILLAGGIVVDCLIPSQAPPPEPVAVADLAQQQPKLLPPDPPRLDQPERRDPTVPSEELRRILSSARKAGYPPAVDWIDDRSKKIVRRVLKREFAVQAVDVRHWSPEGLAAFLEDFEEQFAGEAKADFWDYDYLALHQETLKRRAKQAGVFYDFGEARSHEDFLLPNSLWYELQKRRLDQEDEKKRQQLLQELRAKTPQIQVSPTPMPPAP